MLANPSLVDPWIQTLSLLSMPEAARPRKSESFECAKPRAFAESSTPKCEPIVRIIDRPTSSTVTLDWRDSTRCCYREQLWVAARARVAGRCALSGAAIAPGDEIFRPRPTRPAPRNVNAMVLARAIEAVMPGASLQEAPIRTTLGDSRMLARGTLGVRAPTLVMLLSVVRDGTPR
ncbi:DUF3331 domain-containing protein [Paraburkholderia acidisoli]|uniref:DUF3331 domain-containing protein n=1 Tax=Paraburkholderia acidisoli TaxID=2571748 RepID=A0A7Z2GJR0_9BURK|nr:DUF3331 domain-containing protein [Paraburkholderia acidisoli]QGZ63075.1 DUF3331 domain-containing protein [Paraburkholderia acidisoli]